MNTYEEETKSYYQQLSRKANHMNHMDRYNSGSAISGKMQKSIAGSSEGSQINIVSILVKRIMQELIIVSVLVIFVLGCKSISTPESAQMYKYAKNLLDVDITQDVIKGANLENLQKEFNSAMETFQNKMNNSTLSEEDIKQKFILPIKGDVISDSDGLIQGKGILIKAKADSDVFSAYNGTVRKIMDSDAEGKTVIIDNGNGVETTCGGLKSVYIKEGDKVDKGEVLGKSGEIGKNKVTAVIFKINCKGEEKDPKEVMGL